MFLFVQKSVASDGEIGRYVLCVIYFLIYFMKDIVLFGMPGAGKGTQADLLKTYMPGTYVHLSTGDVFRALMSTSNAIGDHVREKMEQ